MMVVVMTSDGYDSIPMLDLFKENLFLYYD